MTEVNEAKSLKDAGRKQCGNPGCDLCRDYFAARTSRPRHS